MNKRILAIAAIMLVLGLAAGYGLAPRQAAEKTQAGRTSAQKKPLFYRNPMNPAITSPVPAKDEMGMDYIPVYADSGQQQTAPGSVRIDPTVMQDIGVRTAMATKKTISRDIRTVGRIAYDEQLLTRLHPKVNGWIDKLFVSETGEPVKQNTMLLALYSPELVTSEEEYLLALKNADTLKQSPFPDVRQGAEDLVRSSRQRLELLDVPAHQMRALYRTRKVIKNLHIHSPFRGVVVHIGVREGQYVTPQTELYRIADLSKVWVYADIYEYELPWVQEGDIADMRIDALPGHVFHGKITYIYPYLDPATRTNKVRIAFDNPDGLLKPDMFADMDIHASRRLQALVIPTMAIIRTGREPKVFVETAPGRFEPRTVKLGVSDGPDTEILAGVAEGEKVVTSAQFLIDSESSLNEATAKMVAPKNQPSMKMQKPASAPADMNMSGMQMNEAGEKNE
jgi:membrane fusion protein, copper/silver efflux system